MKPKNHLSHQFQQVLTFTCIKVTNIKLSNVNHWTYLEVLMSKRQVAYPQFGIVEHPFLTHFHFYVQSGQLILPHKCPCQDVISKAASIELSTMPFLPHTSASGFSRFPELLDFLAPVEPGQLPGNGKGLSHIQKHSVQGRQSNEIFI